MSGEERLLEYIDGKRPGKCSAAWLAGHYQGMLNDLIGAIGYEVVRRLLAARMDAMAALGRPTPAGTKEEVG